MTATQTMVPENLTLLVQDREGNYRVKDNWKRAVEVKPVGRHRGVYALQKYWEAEITSRLRQDLERNSLSPEELEADAIFLDYKNSILPMVGPLQGTIHHRLMKIVRDIAPDEIKESPNNRIVIESDDAQVQEWMKRNWQRVDAIFQRRHLIYGEERAIQGNDKHGMTAYESGSKYGWSISCHGDEDVHMKQTISDIKSALEQLDAPKGLFEILTSLSE